MLLHAVFALEALDPAGRIDQPMLAGVKRMAVRADLDVNLGLRRTRLESVAACAGHHAATILRMDSSFHRFVPSRSYKPSHPNMRKASAQFFPAAPTLLE
jgi:hypothetical protein